MARCLRRRARLGSPGSRIGGRVSSRIACLCVLLSLPVLVETALSAQILWELFPHTTERGRAAVEYDDDAWVVVAAYYYSQRHHESRWLLIELAVTSDDLLQLRQQDIVLLTPDLTPVPVASHQAVSQDVQRTRPLLQNATLTRHLDRRLGDFFPGRRREHFHWFALTAFEGTVSNYFDVDRHRVAWGDLLFASPTGAWEAGTYELIVQGPGETQAVLPIDLD